MQKSAPKNTKYSRNEIPLKIGHHAKAIAHAKSWPWVKKKFQKTCENPFYKSFRVLLCKNNRSKKQLIFEKWDHFENRPSCKAYSPCKMQTLRHKLKFQKTSQNPFYKLFRVVLCKNPLKETLNISEMIPFWKSAIMQRL